VKFFRNASPPSHVRACFVCRTCLDPGMRIDSVYCSEKCKCRAYRFVAEKKRFELVKELVRRDVREQIEAWRRLERANPENYTRTLMAARLRLEHLKVDAVFEGKAVRRRRN
jgi:CRISPR/Cas system-associated endonuclease Cas1